MKMKKTLIWIIGIILSIQIATAIGVGPVRTNIEFLPNLTTQYSLTVYNTDGKEMQVGLVLEGEMSRYFDLESNAVAFADNEESKKIFFEVSFPRDIIPGTYEGTLWIIEVPESEGMLTATLGVTHEIILNVPKHGKYIETSSTYNQKNIGIEIKNIGLKKIKTINTKSTIRGSEKNIENFFSEKDFESDEELRYNIPLNLDDGEYLHIAEIDYDELTKIESKQFFIGDISIEIINLNLESNIFGKINPINLNISSNWNKPLEIFIEVDVKKGNEVIETIKSRDIIIQEEINERIFWDATNLEEGRYNLDAKVYFNGKIISENNFKISLVEEGEKIIEGMTTKQALIIVLIFMSLTIILMLLLRSKKKES